MQAYGLDIDRTDYDGWPVLFSAIRAHDIRLVNNLIELNADINIQCDGWTALHIAAQERFYEAVELL